jgi:hypothetical protein
MTKCQRQPATDAPATSSFDELAWTRAEPTVLELTDRDMDALLDAIANPPAPNDAMRRAIARWRELGMDAEPPSPDQPNDL